MSVFVGLFSWADGFSREDSLELLPGAQNPHCQQLGCPVPGVLWADRIFQRRNLQSYVEESYEVDLVV